MQFKINKQLIELCVTYRCNIKCNNCSNLCTQAPFRGDLTIDDIKLFLDNIKNHDIRQITIHGGEPVLNPWIYDIIKLLVEYRTKTGVKLWLLTNNSSSAIREKITRISCNYNIALGISTKTGENQLSYIPVNESSIDLELKNTFGCFQLNDCGICFNNEGFFPCSPMAAASRVFGYKSLGKDISIFDHDNEILIHDLINTHCKHCGFAIPNRRRVVEQTTTKTWKEKFEDYERRRKNYENSDFTRYSY